MKYLSILSILLFSGLLHAEELSSLYKKEFSFLEQQKSFLKKRILEHEQTSSKELGTIRAQIKQSESKLISLDQENEKQKEALDSFEDSEARSENKIEIVNEILSNSYKTIGKQEGFDENLREKESVEEKKQKLSKYFGLSLKKLADGSSLIKEDGSFFLRNGKKTDGMIIRLGNVSSFGKSENYSGSLVPAGSGKLKAYPYENSKVANSLFEGRTPDLFEVFLYESMDKEITEKQEKSLADFLEGGGVIGYVIVALGLFALVLIIARVFLLVKAGTRIEKLMERVLPPLKDGDLKKAAEILKKKDSAAKRVIFATIKNLKRDREYIEDVVSEAILHETPEIEKFGNTITAFAAVAPLLGLLGTVTGMISTFDLITEFGTGDPKILSGGISEALITTELGLIVAIPTLLIGSILSSRAEGILGGLETAALNVMNTHFEAKAEAKERLSSTSNEAVSNA